MKYSHFRIPTSELNMCPWPIGRGARFPIWSGEFDSRRALFSNRNCEVGGRKYSKHFRIPTSDFQICNGPSVQSGVDATLSRWRSPVRIRYGSLFPNRNWEVGNRKCELRAAYSDLRFPNSEFETVRYANGLSGRSQKPVSVSSNLTRTTEQNVECGMRNEDCGMRNGKVIPNSPLLQTGGETLVFLA